MGNHAFHALHHHHEKPETKKCLSKFSQGEIRLIKATFKDLALRTPGNTIDKNTFLTHFPLPGLHGEQLFDVFDHKHNGSIDFDEFILGMAVAYKGSVEEKFDFIFRIYDINHDGEISKQELKTMLYQVPKEALHLWHISKTEDSDAENDRTHRINTTERDSQTSETSTERDSLSSGHGEHSLHPNFEDSLKTKSKIGKSQDDLFGNVKEENHIEEIVDKIVADAFGANNEANGKLTQSKFKEWVTKNPEVMALFNSVFTSFGKNSPMPQNSHASSGSAFAPPRRPATPPPHFKHLHFLMRSSSHGSKPEDVDSRPERSSSSSYLAEKKTSHNALKNSHSYSANLCDLHSSSSDVMGKDDLSHVCVKEGYLSKVGRRSKRIQSRYYKLYGNILYYYNTDRSTVPAGVIMLSGCFVDPDELMDHKHYPIKIITGKGGERDERRLLAKTIEERDSWIKVLRKASRDRKFTNKYILQHKIGSGKFSNVYLCKNKTTGVERAVKVIKKDHLSEDEKELLRTEVAILRLVDNPFIVCLVDVFETVENLYLVMELLKGGELYHCIVGRSRFSEDESYILLKQLMEGINYLHAAGIVHRDMKPENILLSKSIPKGQKLDSSFQIKLADFGLSKLVAPDEQMNLPCGTISYVAPEVLMQKGYGKEADLWSAGVIMYLVIRGRLPFDSDDKDAIIKEILEEDITWDKDPVFSKLSPGLVQILSGLLQRDPKVRFTAKAVLEHPWMKQMEEKWMASQLDCKKQIPVEDIKTTNPITA